MEHPERKATIMVHNNDLPKGSDIDIGYNGKNFKIQEGKVVVVPAGILYILQNAIIETPRTDKQHQLVVDENGQQVYDVFNRYIVHIVEDPDKPKKGRPSTAILEERKKQQEASEQVQAAEDEKAKDEEMAIEIEEEISERGPTEKRSGFFGRSK